MTRGLKVAPETKGVGALELKDAFDDFLGAFEAFKRGE